MVDLKSSNWRFPFKQPTMREETIDRKDQMVVRLPLLDPTGLIPPRVVWQYLIILLGVGFSLTFFHD